MANYDNVLHDLIFAVEGLIFDLQELADAGEHAIVSVHALTDYSTRLLDSFQGVSPEELSQWLSDLVNHA